MFVYFREEYDPTVISGKFSEGKLEYQMPTWMMFGGMGVAPVQNPFPVEKLEITNPIGVELVEGKRYQARLIAFEDGSVAEIVKLIEE